MERVSQIEILEEFRLLLVLAGKIILLQILISMKKFRS